MCTVLCNLGPFYSLSGSCYLCWGFQCSCFQDAEICYINLILHTRILYGMSLEEMSFITKRGFEKIDILMEERFILTQWLYSKAYFRRIVLPKLCPSFGKLGKYTPESWLWVPLLVLYCKNDKNSLVIVSSFRQWFNFCRKYFPLPTSLICCSK